jgi:hypothetical protein
MSKVRRHLAANVVAYLALFLALGGGAYAAVTAGKNTVKSKSIKDGQVKTKDLGKDAVVSAKVKDGSLLGMDFAAGQLPPGVTGYQIVQRESARDGTNIKSLQAPCPAGKVLLGGGAILSENTGAVVITTSEPGFEGGVYDWDVNAAEAVPTDEWSLTVKAICAKIGS